MAEREKPETVKQEGCTYWGGKYCVDECMLANQVRVQAERGGPEGTAVWNRDTWDRSMVTTLMAAEGKCGRIDELKATIQRVTQRKEEAGELK